MNPYGQPGYPGQYGQPGMGVPGQYGQPGMGMPGQPGMGMPGQYGQPGMGMPGQYGQPGMGMPGQPGMGMPGQYGHPGMGMPGQPGMGMPGQYGQPGMGMPGQAYGAPGGAFNYRAQNWSGYQMRSYNFSKDQIKHVGKQIFNSNDMARQGWVPAPQVPMMVSQFTQQTGLPPVNPQDVYYILNQVDDDGRVKEKEWLLVLKILAKMTGVDQIKNKKMKWGKH